MLLIHPPVVKPAEPPAGVSRIAGALRTHGVACRIWDANLEGMLALMTASSREEAAAVGMEKAESLHGGNDGPDRSKTWTRRARRHAEANLAKVKQWPLYQHLPLYQRTVRDINRLLQTATLPDIRISLSDYRAADLSALRSADLKQAAASPEGNPFFPFFSQRLTCLIDSQRPRYCGFSLNYLSQALTTFAMIGFLRDRYPELKIILGGSLMTSWACCAPGAENPFQGLVDHLIAGPGEVPLLALYDIPAACDHDYLPDYADLPLHSYLSPGPVLPFSASRGCYWRRCSFCPERSEKTPYRPIPPAVVSAQLTALVGRTEPRLIHFLDNALSPALLKALAENPPGVPWYGFTRFTPDLARADFCAALRRSGCAMLQLGLESGDQDVLDNLDKGIDLKAASRCLKNLKAAGIASYIYLLFGTPAETPAAARRTLEFTLDHAEEIGFLNLAIFNLPLHGPETERLGTAPFYQGDLTLYRQFVHPQGWNRGEARRFLTQEFRRHPTLASILQRDPPFFTSNHAPFFVMPPPDPSPLART